VPRKQGDSSTLRGCSTSRRKSQACQQTIAAVASESWAAAAVSDILLRAEDENGRGSLKRDGSSARGSSSKL
jgi:hypothetical protein